MQDGQTPGKPQQHGTYPAEKRRRERLVVVSIFGFLALNYPMLSVFNLEQLWFGIPLFYWYLFGIWFCFLIAVALIMEWPAHPGDTQDRRD